MLTPHLRPSSYLTNNGVSELQQVITRGQVKDFLKLVFMICHLIIATVNIIAVTERLCLLHPGQVVTLHVAATPLLCLYELQH